MNVTHHDETRSIIRECTRRSETVGMTGTPTRVRKKSWGWIGVTMWLIVSIPMFGEILVTAADEPRSSFRPDNMVVPVMSQGNLEAGRRVGYAFDDELPMLKSSLFLPADWSSTAVENGRRWPVVVEFPGNRFDAGDYGGEIGDASLGYGLSRGDAIWVVLPFVDLAGTSHTVTWWGDADATASHAVKAVDAVIDRLGGDDAKVLLCGFSRGAIAASLVGLRNEAIAERWCAVLTHDHFDGVRGWPNTPWGWPIDEYRRRAATRLRRLCGRPMMVCQTGDIEPTRQWITATLPNADRYVQYATLSEVEATNRGGISTTPTNDTHPHNDRWLMSDTETTQRVRQWYEHVMASTDDNPRPEATRRRIQAIVERLERRKVDAKFSVLGKTASGTLMDLVTIRPENPAASVIILGGIHSGESAGKTAMVQWLETLATSDAGWPFENLTMYLIPTYNPDGDNDRGYGNRPLQWGPVGRKGTRANGDGFDLNRDLMKCDAAETRSLLDLMHTRNVDALIDLHTTNGSVHRFDLTFERPLPPATPDWITRYTRDTLFPVVQTEMAKRGHATNYYGNCDRTIDPTRWSTFACQPRYTTNYAGLVGRIGILAEAYSYVPHRRRVDASRDFVVECLRQLNQDATRIADARRKHDQQSPASIAVRGEIAPSPRDISLPTYQLSARWSNEYPGLIVRKGGLKPLTRSLPHWGEFIGTVRVDTPRGYGIPADQTEVLRRVRWHHLPTRLVKPADRFVSYQIDRVDVDAKPFQGHVRNDITRGHWRSTDTPETTRSMRHAIVVEPKTASQRRLAALLLEPESDDGVAAWNLTKDPPAENQTYPITRLR